MSVTQSGARVVFRVNGAKVAFANALNYTVTHGLTPVDVLDQLEPVEYAETSYVVNFSASMFRVAGQSAVNLGLRPNLQDLLVQPELTAELIDSVTNSTIMLMERVKCSQEDFNVAARDLGQLTLSFVAIKSSADA